MLKLAQILESHGIVKKEFAESVGIGAAALSRLFGEGYFPKTKPDIKADIETKLLALGVSADEIKTVWDAATPQTDKHKHEENDMSKPILTQEARRALNLDPLAALFENDINEMGDVFETEDTAYVRALMRNAALNGGFIAIISEPGGGKSTLANDLEDYCLSEKKNIRFIRPDHIAVERLSASGIYDAIIDDISEGTEKPKRSLEYKARQAKRLLKESHAEGRRHALILEESQGILPGTLKNLKRFWEIRSGHRAVLAIIMIGQSELKRHLADDAYNTREVALRCQVVELKPFTAKQVYAYMHLKFEKTCLDVDSVFSQDACTAIHARLHDGQNSFCYPQRINNLVVRVINKWAEIGGAALGKIGADLILGDLTLRREV
jgi:type II secretory pathway predicted ATPase ExeA